MSLVNDMLQDLDARWQPSHDGLQLVTHSSSVRLGESLEVPAANSLPSGLSSEISGEPDLGRQQWQHAPAYFFASGLLVLLVVGTGVVIASGKPSTATVLITSPSSPSEQVLVAEVLQSPDTADFLGMTSAGYKAEGSASEASENAAVDELGSLALPPLKVVNTVVSPLFKTNKVVELQERGSAVLAVLDDAVLSPVNTLEKASSSSVGDSNVRTQFPELVDSIQPVDDPSASALQLAPEGNPLAITAESAESPIALTQPTREQILSFDAPVLVAAPVVSVDDLLLQARRAFELQRYREPEGDNAYDLYQVVLAKETNNAAALAGIMAIQQAYLGLIRRVIGKNYYYKVPELAKSARAVGASQADIEAVIASVPEHKEKPVRDAMAQTKAYEQDKRQRKDAAAQATGKNAVSVSEQTHDQRLAQQARQLLKSGQLSAAEDMLRAYVTSQPRSQVSLQTLFGVYIQQQKLTDAESLLVQAQHLPGAEFSYLVAQLLIQRGDIKGAMRSLTSQQPGLSRYPAYYALMAALYHKLGQNRSAQALYQRLVAHNKVNPSYWLGLAMARDGQGAPAALQAFRQVRRLTPKPVSYSAYVNKRIDALSRLQG